MAIKIIQRHITKNQSYIKNQKQEDSRYTLFQRHGAFGAVLHSIGAPQPSAEVIAKNFDDPEEKSSVHMVLQPDGLCYQLAPLNYRLWHVAGSGNDTHIGIEMTEPDCIWYDAKNGYKLHIRNKSKALEHVVKVYNCAVELFAQLCIENGWNPLEDGRILSHDECHKRGMGSDHGDPEKLWNALDTGYTMDTFRAAVDKRMKEMQEDELESKISVTVKRILSEMKEDSNDNDSSKWSAEAREWAIRKGITNGVGTDDAGNVNYAWGSLLTREQMVTMLYRFSQLLNCPYLREHGGG